MIIIINKSTETDNHHHYQTKWWSVAIDVGFVSTRAISIFRTEKLYLYTNAKTVVENLTNHFIDRHIKTQIVVMNKHKKCSLKQRQWCIICTCTQASTTTGWSQLPERSKPWLKRVFSGFRLALNHKFYVLMVFIHHTAEKNSYYNVMVFPQLLFKIHNAFFESDWMNLKRNLKATYQKG